jgi:hypothetical protein
MIKKIIFFIFLFCVIFVTIIPNTCNSNDQQYFTYEYYAENLQKDFYPFIEKSIPQLYSMPDKQQKQILANKIYDQTITFFKKHNWVLILPPEITITDLSSEKYVVVILQFVFSFYNSKDSTEFCQLGYIFGKNYIIYSGSTGEIQARR